MDDQLQQLGRRLRRLRREKNMTQEQVAERADLHPTYISRIERGRSMPTIEVLSRIAAVLDVPLTGILQVLETGGAPGAGRALAREDPPRWHTPDGDPAPADLAAEIEQLLQGCSRRQLALIRDFVGLLLRNEHLR